MDFINTILYPIEVAEAYVMVFFHWLATVVGIPGTSGWAWALSIVGLTAVVRLLLVPLFVKQIHASRRLQLIQPEMQKIQAKYKGKTDPESRQAMSQETMELYKRTGTNPFSSCLPILFQSPFFFALFTVLNNLKAIAVGNHAPIGPITADLAQQAESSTLFGAQLSSSFMFSDSVSTKILTAVLIILMSVTTFTTQHQLMRKNMPASALEGPFAQQQKILLYVLPLIFAVSGVNFPIGVLIYWLTTNVWTMGQQFYVIRRMPAPGSAAEKALHERRAKHGKPINKLTLPGLNADGEEADIQDEATKGGQRQQPVRKSRAKTKRPSGPGTPGGGGSAGISDQGPKASPRDL